MTVVTANQVDRAESVTSALEEVLYHLHSAKEELEGSGSRTVEHISMIEEIISAAEEEKAEYDAILDKADAQELAAMNREYERSVL